MSLPVESISNVDAGSDDVALSFGSWRTPNSSRPTWVQGQVFLDSGSTVEATIGFQVDEGGGTTSDYGFDEVLPAGLGTTDSRQACLYVPAGGSYQIVNSSDPNNNNAIQFVREFTW